MMKTSLGATLAELRKAKKLTQKALAAKMGEYGFAVYNKTIYNWEKGLAQPSVPHFLALCDILDVDDALWTFAGLERGPYAGLNQAGREKARGFIDLIFHIDIYREHPDIYRDSPDIHSDGPDIHRDSPAISRGDPAANGIEPRLLRLYDIPVSAGMGNFLDASGYETIEAPGYVPAEADFALRISGDSMEPLLQDGQVIWVKEQETLGSGDIGIFTYFDDVYCKKLVVDSDRAYLHSMNPAYEDIEIKEDHGFRIIGKVV